MRDPGWSVHQTSVVLKRRDTLAPAVSEGESGGKSSVEV